MEIIRFNEPDSQSIIISNRFVVDQIWVERVKFMNGNLFSIVFNCQQNSTEDTLYLETVIAANNILDRVVLENIAKYNKSEDIDSGLLYKCNFTLVEADKMPYFLDTAYHVLDTVGHIAKVDLHFTRDSFIRYSIFMRELFDLNDTNPDNILIFSKKYNHMKFSTVNRVKLEDNCIMNDDKKGVQTVVSYYICGNGPEEYKIINITEKLEHKMPKICTSAEVFMKLYSGYNPEYMIYEPVRDCLYVLYDVFSDVTGDYKETKVLRFYKEYYDKTNFIDNTKIY